MIRYLLLVVLTGVLIVTPAPAGNYCYRNPSTYATHYTYYEAHYYNGRWYPAGSYALISGQYHLQGYGAFHGYSCPEEYHGTRHFYADHDSGFFFSTREHYRDSLLADALAWRLSLIVQGKGDQVGNYPGQALPQAGASDETTAKGARALVKAKPAISTPVAKELKEYFTASCLKCHNGPGGKKGVDVTRLESFDEDQRAKVFANVSAGLMPPNGQPAPEATMKLIFDWWQAGAKASASSLTSNVSP